MTWVKGRDTKNAGSAAHETGCLPLPGETAKEISMDADARDEILRRFKAAVNMEPEEARLPHGRAIASG
ncbi:MAG: hypothetical protein ACYC0C_10975 [Devosia sp.]